jgi:hypothetical protein
VEVRPSPRILLVSEQRGRTRAVRPEMNTQPARRPDCSRVHRDAVIGENGAEGLSHFRRMLRPMSISDRREPRCRGRDTGTLRIVDVEVGDQVKTSVKSNGLYLVPIVREHPSILRIDDEQIERIVISRPYPTEILDRRFCRAVTARCHRARDPDRRKSPAVVTAGAEDSSGEGRTRLGSPLSRRQLLRIDGGRPLRCTWTPPCRCGLSDTRRASDEIVSAIPL